MDPYLFAYGGFIVSALFMGLGTLLIIKLDQPKRPKKKIDG